MTPAPLRVGIAGAGWAARRLHAPALRACRTSRLVAVVDPRPRARAALSVAGYPDIDALLASGSCDALIVASPPDSHAAIAEKAVRGGLHVLVEKPLAVDLAGGEVIAAAARAARRVVAVGFNLRCHPDLVRLRQYVASRAYGPLLEVNVVWGTSAGLAARDWLGWRARGGGVLFDLASHVVDLWRWLGGDEIAQLDAQVEAHPIDDVRASIRGTLCGGAALTAELSLVGPDRFEVVVRCRERTFSVRPYRGGLAQSYARQCEAWAAAIMHGARPAADVDDGLAALRWVEALAHGKPVPAARATPPARFPITFLVPTSRDFDAIRTTVEHLAAQTIARDAELVLVAPTVEALAEATVHAPAFGAIQRVAAGQGASVGESIAAGVRHARGRIVALAEDHCFPDADWAEALLAAHDSDCSVVGPVLRNANPRTSVSEADFAMAYGAWMDPMPACDVAYLPGHNSSYKRDELLALGDRLPALLEAETVLHMHWASEGRRLRVEPHARMRHVNFSRWRSFGPATFHNGRAFGGARAKTWPLSRRLLYAGASPLIPAVRFVRIAREFARPGRSMRRLLRMLPALVAGLAIDAAGQCLGYLAGSGQAMRHLSRYEYNRRDHVRPEERALWISR